jgi:hypothetical protein
MTTATRSEIRWEARPTAGHDRHGQSSVYDSETGKDIAIVYDGAAHGDLIAAAPELLETQRHMLLDDAAGIIAEYIDEHGETPAMAYVRDELTAVAMQMRSAIAKAEGR